MFAVRTYRPEVYSAVPDLHVAAGKFKALNGAAAVEKGFKDLFRRHGMERKFGLTMVHRHFNMASNERLVEYGSTSTQWEMNKDSDVVKPHCWILGGLMALPPTNSATTRPARKRAFLDLALTLVTTLKVAFKLPKGVPISIFPFPR
ncbi:hypothetical protein ACKVV7_001515 [Pyricularia oryzae]